MIKYKITMLIKTIIFLEINTELIILKGKKSISGKVLSMKDQNSNKKIKLNIH